MNRQAEHKRDGILDEMRQIERLRQGTISEQFYGTGENKQGPYYVLQGYTAEGKHWSRRVPRDQIKQVREDLGAGVRFKELSREFAEVTEQATITEDRPASKKKPGSAARTLPGNRSVPEDDRGRVRRHRHAGNGGYRRRLAVCFDARWVPDSGGILQAARPTMRTATQRWRTPLSATPSAGSQCVGKVMPVARLFLRWQARSGTVG